MAKKNGLKTFYIQARLALDTGLNIEAESLEDALVKSKALSVTDFIEIEGDHNDSELKITGVFEDYSQLKL